MEVPEVGPTSQELVVRVFIENVTVEPRPEGSKGVCPEETGEQGTRPEAGEQ